MKTDIIVADDERVIRQAVSGLLEANGHVVRVARNGEEALRLYQDRRPDLMLLDVMMPKGNGYEVCATIRFLMTRFWGASFEGNDSTLSIAILRLREKLGETASTLRSVRGSGYVWRLV